MDQPVAIAEESTRRRSLMTALVWAGAAAGLYWVLHDFDWKEFVADLAFIEWKWVIPAVLFDVLSYVVQAVRWNYILRPLGAPSILRSTQAIYVGLFTNELLPLRGGEFVRAFLVAQWTELPFSVVLSSVAIERLMDGIWLAVGFGITALVLTLPPVFAHGAQILGVLVLVGIALLIAVLAEGLKVTHALERTRAGQRHLLSMLLHFIDRLFEGLQTIGHSASLYWAMAASLLLLITQILAVWFMMWSYGLYFSFWVASAVLLILHLGTAIPNAPANLGSFQVTCVAALLLFGVDKTTATEFTLVMFVILTAPLLIIGTLSLLWSGLSFQDIRRHARRAVGSR